MKIIITGSEGLIGRNLCRHLEEKGHTLIKLDLQNGNDLTDESFVTEFFSKNTADALIVCHAIDDKISNKRQSSSYLDFPLDELRNSFNVNVTSNFSVCRQYIKNNQLGSIVCFSSIYGLRSPKKEIYDSAHKFIGYGMSKASVINLTQYLAAHCEKSIRINCVVPGGITMNESKKFNKEYSKLVPLKRMMKVHEIYGIVDYLISDEASYTNGSIFCIDGGYLA